MGNLKGVFLHKSDHWQTPEDFYALLDSEFHFTLDPCPLYSLHDGLTLSWEGHTVFCNPPYSDIRPWVMKAYKELLSHNVTTVLLLPARTDTQWFHDLILPRCEIRFIRGRLRFGGSKQNAPFPSMICIFRR